MAITLTPHATKIVHLPSISLIPSYPLLCTSIHPANYLPLPPAIVSIHGCLASPPPLPARHDPLLSKGFGSSDARPDYTSKISTIATHLFLLSMHDFSLEIDRMNQIPRESPITPFKKSTLYTSTEPELSHVPHPDPLIAQ